MTAFYPVQYARATRLVKITNSGVEEPSTGRHAVQQVRAALDEAEDGPHDEIVVGDFFVWRVKFFIGDSLRN
jgi:hypothetical protein